MTERIIRQAARPLLQKLVTPLDADDLYQVGRLALWQAGDIPESHQYVVARGAMIDELRRARWSSRGAYSDGAAWEMTSHDAWEHGHDGMTDCQAASMVAVLQCIAKIQKMQDRDREVLERLAYGMSAQEVAEHIGIAPASVSSIVGRLRRQIEGELEYSGAMLGRLSSIVDGPHEVESSSNAAGLAGVQASGAKWIARIKVAGRDKHLGTFKTADEAHAAYRVARRRYLGQ